MRRSTISKFSFITSLIVLMGLAWTVFSYQPSREVSSSDYHAGGDQDFNGALTGKFNPVGRVVSNLTGTSTGRQEAVSSHAGHDAVTDARGEPEDSGNFAVRTPISGADGGEVDLPFARVEFPAGALPFDFEASVSMISRKELPRERMAINPGLRKLTGDAVSIAVHEAVDGTGAGGGRDGVYDVPVRIVFKLQDIENYNIRNLAVLFWDPFWNGWLPLPRRSILPDEARHELGTLVHHFPSTLILADGEYAPEVDSSLGSVDIEYYSDPSAGENYASPEFIEYVKAGIARGAAFMAENYFQLPFPLPPTDLDADGDGIPNGLDPVPFCNRGDMDLDGVEDCYSPCITCPIDCPICTPPPEWWENDSDGDTVVDARDAFPWDADGQVNPVAPVTCNSPCTVHVPTGEVSVHLAPISSWDVFVGNNLTVWGVASSREPVIGITTAPNAYDIDMASGQFVPNLGWPTPNLSRWLDEYGVAHPYQNLRGYDYFIDDIIISTTAHELHHRVQIDRYLNLDPSWYPEREDPGFPLGFLGEATAPWVGAAVAFGSHSEAGGNEKLNIEPYYLGPWHGRHWDNEADRDSNGTYPLYFTYSFHQFYNWFRDHSLNLWDPYGGVRGYESHVFIRYLEHRFGPTVISLLWYAVSLFSWKNYQEMAAEKEDMYLEALTMILEAQGTTLQEIFEEFAVDLRVKGDFFSTTSGEPWFEKPNGNHAGDWLYLGDGHRQVFEPAGPGYTFFFGESGGSRQFAARLDHLEFDSYTVALSPGSSHANLSVDVGFGASTCPDVKVMLFQLSREGEAISLLDPGSNLLTITADGSGGNPHQEITMESGGTDHLTILLLNRSLHEDDINVIVQVSALAERHIEDACLDDAAVNVRDPLFENFLRMDHSVIPLSAAPFAGGEEFFDENFNGTLLLIGGATLLFNRPTLNAELIFLGRSTCWAGRQLFMPDSVPVSLSWLPFPDETMQPSSTLLANGRVLLAGGAVFTPANEISKATNQAGAYDPVANSFIESNPMNVGRVFHTATLLKDGKVLVVGGSNENSSELRSLEIFDPSTNTFSYIGDLSYGRVAHSSILLDDGRVLIAGGSSKIAEIYDPHSSTISTIPHDMMLTGVAATKLQNGNVLFSGGIEAVVRDAAVEVRAMDQLVLFDASSLSFKRVNSMSERRIYHTASLFADGNVMIAGGVDSIDPTDSPTRSVELFNPGDNSVTLMWPLEHSRCRHAASVLPDGRILVTGGVTDKGMGIVEAEFYEPAIYTGGMKACNCLAVGLEAGGGGHSCLVMLFIIFLMAILKRSLGGRNPLRPVK